MSGEFLLITSCSLLLTHYFLLITSYFSPIMRLISLDVFRGLTIAGMILVNMASLGDTYPWLDHAPWHGWTFADLIFPFFLYIIGVAMAFSFAKYTSGELRPTKDVYLKILRRSLILFALGLMLNGFWQYDLANIRLMGVLQRIAIAYFITAIAILNLPKKGVWILAGVILIGYWLIMALVPAPDNADGVFSKLGNFGAYLDRVIIPKAHLYKGDKYNLMGDPEGLFSTLSATVNVLFGYLTGEWLKRQPESSRTSINLALAGFAALVIGEIISIWFPINKKLWTSSYVVFMTGWSLLLMAACYYLVDVRKYRNWFKPFEVMGLNAIFAFVASVLVIKLLVKNNIGTGDKAISVYQWLNQTLFGWAGTLNSGLLFALSTVLFWLAVCYVMYRQRWFIKI
jgi:predicted acyltransferase